MRETVERKLAEMRRELTGLNPSALEKLLVDRVVACWLQLNHADTAYTGNQSQSVAVRKELDKRQDSAQRRYLGAIKQLEQLQKRLPSTVKTKSESSGDPLRAGRRPKAVRLDEDPLLAGRRPRAAPVNDDPLLAAFAGSVKLNMTDDPFLAKQLGEPSETMFDKDFPRISKEHEADSLVNGVGVMN